MKTLKKTNTSLTGFSYKLSFEKGSKQPYAVECFKCGELFEVDYFTTKKKATTFFNSASIGLQVINLK